MYKNLIFDFDGTVIDTSPGIIQTFNQVLTEYGREPVAGEVITGMIGYPLGHIIKELFEDGSQQMIDDACDSFRALYKSGGYKINEPFAGMEDLLKAIHTSSGQRALIVSNKPQHFIEMILDQNDFTHYFEHVRGSNDKMVHSKKADNLREVMEQFGCTAEDTVMIGDAESDIEAAKANDVFVVGVSYGYRTPERLKEVGADLVLPTVADLHGFLIP